MITVEPRTLRTMPRAWPPERILILYNPTVGRSAELASEIFDFLAGQPHLVPTRATIADATQDDGAAGQDLAIVLGGDGSMLLTGAMAARHGTPLLGINLGRLGFLGEVQPAGWPEALQHVLAGNCWLEERMMLHVEHRREGQLLGSYEALNEAVVGRGAIARPVRLKTLIDGGELTTYVADGLIMATPTGSTAYALAVGGPILPPELRNILLVAIAPHLSIDRAIVLPQGAAVQVVVRTDHQAMLSADGAHPVPLQDGDAVDVRMSDFTTCFVRVRSRHYFYTSLMQRMQQNPSADK
jgi:NAD+ kinase